MQTFLLGSKCLGDLIGGLVGLETQAMVLHGAKVLC